MFSFLNQTPKLAPVNSDNVTDDQLLPSFTVGQSLLLAGAARIDKD